MKYIKRSISILLALSIFLTMAAGTLTVNASTTGYSDDYRAWSHRDSRWADTPMGSTTLSDGGAPTTAITKLAIQAGLRDAHDFGVGDMASLLSYSGKSIVWNSACTASNLFAQKDVFYDNSTGITSSTKTGEIITKVKQGWHLVIGVKNSSGGNFVAVDEKLTLASGSTVYIMDCTTNKSNNINVSLTKRYGTITKIVGYKGEASRNSSVNDDYRKWELNNTNWAGTTLFTDANSYKYTVGNSGSESTYSVGSVTGGGDLVMASAKLAYQAGLKNPQSYSINDAVSGINNFTAGGLVNSWDSIKTEFGFESYNNALMGSASNTVDTMSTSLTATVTSIINYLNQGYFLAIRINSSVGWVAVDTDKTLATGEVYIMRSTPDASKNADIKLSEYYDTMNRVAGFKTEGVQVNFSGNATFTAKYVPDGSSTEYSLSSGGFVPDEATVTITATPKSGYTAADNWTITGGYSGTPTHTSTTYSFKADKDVATSAAVTYTAAPKTYDIGYIYGTNSSSFTYATPQTTLPTTATTGSTVNMTISPKTDGSFVYELKVDVRDSENHQIPVTHSGTTYSFTMPASDVTVTFTGQNVDDWRRWARDDERWRDTDMTETTDVVDSVKDNGAVMIGLTKLSLQAGVKIPTTLTEDNWDINDTVHALQSNINQTGNQVAQLVFNDNTASPIGFDEYHAFLSVSNATSSNRGDIKEGYCDTIVDNLKNGYHQILRICSNASSLVNADSEWVTIDEEKTLEAVGKKERACTAITASDIYIFRATADVDKNANTTLKDLYDETGGDSNGGYRYVWRNYAYLGGTTPARQVNITLKNGDTEVTDAHKGDVTSTYTIAGEDAQSFVSGDYVPSRATIKIKYNADPGYFAFENWTTSEDSDLAVFTSAQTANPKEFTVTASEFRASTATITHSTTANIDCNITPEIYHIYYTDGSRFAYGNAPSEAGYNTSVSFTINPDSGYTVDAASVAFKDADDNTISGLTAEKAGRTYTFTMPAKDIYISATASAQTYDDYRMWGIGESDRWGNSYLRKIVGSTPAQGKISDNVGEGGTLFMAFTKLMIQAGFNAPYDPYNATGNTATVTGLATNVADGTSEGIYAYRNNELNGDLYWGVMGNKLGIISSYGTSGTYNNYWDYNVTGGATARGSSDRSQAYIYRRLFGTSVASPYNATTYAPLIRDYLRGDHSEAGKSNAQILNFNTWFYNDYDYKFHIMLNVSGYGWVAVDEALTLNDPDGEIWVWASRGRVASNATGAANICKLSDINANNQFTQIAAFKFPTSGNANYFGSSKNSYVAKLGNSTTNNATLEASYTYLGAEYGPYSTGFYVPHGAAVTVTRTALTEHYQPATGKTHGAWEISDGYGSHSNTILLYDTAKQNGANARKEYSSEYYITAIPQVRVRFQSDEHGTLNGVKNGTSADPISGYQDEPIALTITPDANYEINTLEIIKTDSGWSNPEDPEGIALDSTEVSFGSDLTGGETTSYFIVKATFKGVGLRITYNFQEFNPTRAGTHEYKEGDGYLDNKTYTKEIDAYAGTQADAVSKVAANVPALQNVYFDYTCTPLAENITYNTEGTVHTASITLTPVVKEYTVSVNGRAIDGVFHYQEELSLDASDYGVDSDNVVWTRDAESGKIGSAKVCYNPVYSFRVTSDLYLTAAENLGSTTSVDGTSAITPGYTEIDRVNNVEKCIQNFYIQDFYDTSSPKVYDSNGDVIEGASDITFLGAGVLFYAFDTNTNKPAKASLGETEPSRETMNSLLDTNKNAFISEATGQGGNFKGSNINYSYINASTDNNNKMRYSTTTHSYNYFFSAFINNNRVAENQKYVYRVYSFYVCSYTLNGNTYVTPVLSDSYAQATLYTLS